VKSVATVTLLLVKEVMLCNEFQKRINHMMLALHYQLDKDGGYYINIMVACDANATKIGQKCILPATFTGSPRHMHEYTLRANM